MKNKLLHDYILNFYFWCWMFWGAMLYLIVRAQPAFNVQIWIVAVMIAVHGFMTAYKYWRDSY